jgi:AcrR family transcriptional regulator
MASLAFTRGTGRRDQLNVRLPRGGGPDRGIARTRAKLSWYARKGLLYGHHACYHTYMHVRSSPPVSRSTARTAGTSPRRTQVERSARSRSALLESAARQLSRYGYGNLKLEQVAREAGYTRGALYHQFKDKEDLALAVIEWVNENWMREVGGPAKEEPDPVAELIALARGHAVFCRRDIARVVMALRVEFSGQDHPVGREIERISETGVKRVARLIDAGRRDGSIPPGPPARAVALAFWGALEGAVIGLARQAPHDELLAARTVAGVLGLDSPPAPPPA